MTSDSYTYHTFETIEEVPNTSGYEPRGFAVLVRVPESDGLKQANSLGLVIPEEAKRRDYLATQCVQVVAIGRTAWREEPVPRAAIGEWVLIESNAGKQLTPGADGINYRMINDIHVFAAKKGPHHAA